MTNFATQFKTEVQRISRKELRAEVTPLRKGVATHRSEIAELKRRISALEASLKKLTKLTTTAAKPSASEDETSSLRWRADGFASHRQKLGLSAEDFGKLLGVSSATIYAWENGTRPRASKMADIARVRKMGKRAALQALAALQ